MPDCRIKDSEAYSQKSVLKITDHETKITASETVNKGRHTQAIGPVL